MFDGRPPSVFLLSVLFLILIFRPLFAEETGTVRFAAMGDVPYSPQEYDTLRRQIEDLNAQDRVEFVVHLGDIKTSSQPCEETYYADAAALLKTINAPTFIIPGDNEVNDCPDPAGAWTLWEKHFTEFEKNWKVPFVVHRQQERPENFSFIRGDVLFIGLHIVGGRVPSWSEWKKRLRQDADWVETCFSRHGKEVRGAVLFAHASGVKMFRRKSTGKQAVFTNRFRKSAVSFAKPILYLQGDGHVWIKDKPWPEKNIMRVQVTQGGLADPLQIEIPADSRDMDLFVVPTELRNPVR